MWGGSKAALSLADPTAEAQEERMLGPPPCVYPEVGATQGRGLEDRTGWALEEKGKIRQGVHE